MTQPNIVFILIDDMGWRDLSCYGSAFYETPHLDRLAREGMRFTDAYASCPVCSPTRASLLTGKYPARLGVTDWIDWGCSWHPCRGRLVEVPYVKQLPLEEFNLARALGAGGYQTWHVGKWHLGQAPFYPERQGFDINIGGWEMGCPMNGYFSPWKFPNLPDGEPGQYLTDRLTDDALKLIAARDPQRPFFMNFWHYAVHTPIQAPAHLVEKYKAKAVRMGLDKLPALIEGEPFPTENKKRMRVTRRVVQSDPVYAAMVENLDTNIGRLLEALPENTLVLFTSDNGGLATAEGSPTSNHPLAEGKGWMYEGGTREPFIVRWPGVVPAGHVCEAPITSPDVYPTLLEAAGLPPRPDQHVDGVSFMPALRGEGAFDRGPLFWHYPHYGNQGGTPGASIRLGDWKLIEFYETGKRELYNVRADISETHDRTAEEPERVRDLHARLTAWRKGIEAKIPQPNPEWLEPGPVSPENLAQAAEKTAWAGRWIQSDDAPRDRNAYAFFRRDFSLTKAGVLKVAITADSFYELHVDGVRIGRGPARSHLGYYAFDRRRVRLKAGRHCIGVLVHHIGVQNATVMTGRPGLLIEMEAGGKTWGTDASWRALRGEAWRSDLPCLMSHFGFWEECDLARMPDGWACPGFDDRAWSPATVAGIPPCAPWKRLIEPDIPPPRETTIPVRAVTASGTWTQGLVVEDDQAKRNVVAGGWLAGAPTTDIPSKQAAARIRTAVAPPARLPASLPSAGEGVWMTVDFGRTISGYPCVTVETDDSGVVVDLSYDDRVEPDGAVNPERSYARLTDRFRLAKGVNILRPYSPRGFRYVMIDAAGVRPVRVTAAAAVEETYAFKAPAGFRSSDPVLGTFAARGAETVRICTTDAFTDCASRERVQWMEDLYQHAHVAAYAFGDVKMMRRALFQGAQNALPDGRINGFMPSERTGCAFASSSLIWLRLLAEYRLFSGDEEACGRLVPAAKRLLELLASLSDSSGLITRWPGGQFWDWSPIEGQGCLLLTNAFYIWALSRLAEDPFFARELGSGPGHRAERMRASAHARFWDPDRRLYRDGGPGKTPIFSQHANALAVLAGICPPAARVPLMKRIIDPARLGPVPVGEHSLNDQNRPDPDQLVPVGTLWFGHFLCQALFEAGLDREALDQMRLLWGAYPESPTFPETRIQKGNTSQCHGWAGGPAWLLPAYVLGVRPVAAGWSQVAVAPHPGGLTSASGTVPTPHGPVAVSWRLGAHGKIEVDVKAPAGVRIVGRVTNRRCRS